MEMVLEMVRNQEILLEETMLAAERIEVLEMVPREILFEAGQMAGKELAEMRPEELVLRVVVL